MNKINSGPKIQCAKCKDIIQSTSIHDLVFCKCGAIAIDGGGVYTRLIGWPEDIIVLKEDKNDKTTK